MRFSPIGEVGLGTDAAHLLSPIVLVMSIGTMGPHVYLVPLSMCLVWRQNEIE
jgi:hypothetical protein